MSKVQLNPNLPPAKNLTPEVLKANPLLGQLARIRLREIKQAKSS